MLKMCRQSASLICRCNGYNDALSEKNMYNMRAKECKFSPENSHEIIETSNCYVIDPTACALLLLHGITL